ncbi:ferredoxin reductase family protein [Dethiobacter alkaliphilus]|uniref:Oxidoreductase FAD/NAD(P)-binding domain protein n=1 Tax=Dethiobacter alkaliphilus AHT 1 TaxID=555088 RepID=C0GK44_DETAL|nr:ferredoxin reductase family protein [Dethiobacter alkaliphilus]EEG76314.1 oxidoreductase FAD/NAD(P)-binding domain protein [Dethiobacter alkaliphilus AHT 1]
MNKEKKFWLFASMLLLIAILAWWSAIPFDTEVFIVRQLNRLAAVLGFLFFFVQFLLSARLKLIEEGFGLDRMLRYHRNVGRLALGFLLLHPALWLIYERQQGILFIWTVFRIIGIVVLVGLMITAAVAALYKKLNLPYELWLNIHKANYILFPLVFVHVFANAFPGTGLFYLWIVLAVLFALLIIHKLRREIQLRKNPFEVVDVKQEAADIWSLYFKGNSFSYQPGQFMHLRLLRDGEVSSPHPFTISSSPTRELVSVTAKELGDFTQTIKNTKVGHKAYIDAPYGVFSFVNSSTEKLAFIAGGIGITPFMSMLRYMYDNQIDRKITLLWGNKSEEELCFSDELAVMEREMDNLQLVRIMSRQKDWPGEKGRVDREKIEKYIPDYAEHQFYVCGPPAMSRATIEALKSMGITKDQIHHELFEL